MSNNYIEFKINNDGSIKCNIFSNGKSMIINNQVKCRTLFKIAYKKNFNHKEVGNSLFFDNADKILNIYEAIVQKNEYRNLRINRDAVKKLKRAKIIRKNGFKVAMVMGAFLLFGVSSKSITSLANDITTKEDVSSEIDMDVSNEDLNLGTIKSNYVEDDILNYQLDNNIDDYVSILGNINGYMEDTENLGQVVSNNTDGSEIVTFCFDGDDLGERLEFKCAKDYESVFEKYGNTYGIDSKLLMAIAAQEGSGVHKEYSANGHALGIMQIELAVWVGNKLTAYNFDTGMEETITVNESDLGNVDYNIKVGAMIFQNVLEQYSYNIPLALQAYNFGSGNIEKMLNTCSNLTGVSIDKMISDINYTEWMYYRNFLGVGDGNYVEHVLENLENDEELVVTKRDLEEVKIKINNTGIKNKSR